jgi:bifunctional non-homologous end joining protein LigD
MLTRRALDWTARFPGIAAAVAKLRARSAYLNSEIVVLDKDGVSDYGALHEAGLTRA